MELEHDKPPTMADVKPALALESLARIYGASQPGLPTIEFPAKYEKALRQIALLLQGKSPTAMRRSKPMKGRSLHTACESQN